MAQFPPDWQLFPESEYATFHRAPLEDTGTGLNVLVPFSAAGRAGGAFRIDLFGSEGFTVKFPLAKVMADLPPDLKDIQVELAHTLEDITPPANLTTTAWEDAEDMYKKRVLILSMPDGSPVPEAALLAYLRAPSSDKSCLGASFRWAVAGTSGPSLQLELQSLPTQARFLTKPNLKADNCVSVLIVKFAVNADLFDGISHAGPVPIIFTPDRTATAAALAAFPASLHDDISAVNNHFLTMEHLTLTEAVAYLQKGKARRAMGAPTFILDTLTGTAGPSQPPKKARFNQIPAMDTGRNFVNISATLLTIP